MEKNSLNQGTGGFIPKRVIAVPNNHDGIGDPPGMVYRLIAVGVQGIQRIETVSLRVVDSGRLIRVEYINRLAQTPVERRPFSPSGGCNGGIFPFGIDDDDGAGP